MEVREYDNQDTKIMSMFIQNKHTYNNEKKLTGECNTNT